MEFPGAAAAGQCRVRCLGVGLVDRLAARDDPGDPAHRHAHCLRLTLGTQADRRGPVAAGRDPLEHRPHETFARAQLHEVERLADARLKRGGEFVGPRRARAGEHESTADEQAGDVQDHAEMFHGVPTP